MWSQPDPAIRLGGAMPHTPDGGHNMPIVRASEYPGSGMVSDACSLAFADPERNVGFGYVMNRMAPDSRTADSLVAAAATCSG